MKKILADVTGDFGGTMNVRRVEFELDGGPTWIHGACPLWVISRHMQCKTACRLCLDLDQKGTCLVQSRFGRYRRLLCCGGNHGLDCGPIKVPSKAARPRPRFTSTADMCGVLTHVRFVPIADNVR